MAKRGVFSLSKKQDTGKKKQGNLIKETLKRNKNKYMCDHINADNGKAMVKPIKGEPTKYRCKFCEDVIETDERVINPESVRDAAEIISSAISIVDLKIAVNSEIRDMFVTTKQTIDILPIILDELKKEKIAKNDKHKKHGKKKGPKRRF